MILSTAGSRGSTNDGSHGLFLVSSTHSSTGISVTRSVVSHAVRPPQVTFT